MSKYTPARKREELVWLRHRLVDVMADLTRFASKAEDCEATAVEGTLMRAEAKVLSAIHLLDDVYLSDPDDPAGLPVEEDPT